MNIYGFRRLTLFGYRWFFHAAGDNGEIVFQSEAYNSRAAAEKTAQMIRREAGTASIIFDPEKVR